MKSENHKPKRPRKGFESSGTSGLCAKMKPSDLGASLVLLHQPQAHHHAGYVPNGINQSGARTSRLLFVARAVGGELGTR